MSDLEAPGAYVHVPYCAHRCSYCSFVATTERRDEERYFEALKAEIQARGGEVKGALDTVYFGGGTPSLVSPDRLKGVLAVLDEVFGVPSHAEITAEGNPDDLTPERLDALFEVGVRRLSIGVQSLSDDELVYLERRHDAAGALTALRLAVERFPNVSGDLMIGIPGQTSESLVRSLEGLLGAGVRHVSVYLFEIEKAPKLKDLMAVEPSLFADDELCAVLWEEVDARATAAGLPRYEVSNWAAPGFESRHNIKYWTGAPTLGFGVSAHSFTQGTRRANTGALVEYLRRVSEAGNAFVARVDLDPVEALRERVLLGLRLSRGVLERDFEAARETLDAEDQARLSDAELAGLLERRHERVELTRRGVLLSNEVFCAFV